MGHETESAFAELLEELGDLHRRLVDQLDLGQFGIDRTSRRRALAFYTERFHLIEEAP